MISQLESAGSMDASVKTSAGSNPLVSRTFENLYAMYLPSVRRCVNGRIKNIALVEDIIQTVFIKVWVYLLSGQPLHENAEGFLVVTAKNCVADYFRSLKRNRVSDLFDESVGRDRRKELFTTDTATIDPSIVEKVQGRVELLEDAYRIPVLLHYVDGLTMREVALRLNISEELVYQRLSRARRKILQSFPKRIRDNPHLLTRAYQA